MAGRIYLLGNGSDLMPMEEARYDSEDLLQAMLAQYPDLLAGEQIDGAQPRRWLLVTREMAVPGEEAGSGRWSLDHLFLDQDGVPTLVEVKRSTDTRIRREVIGQMLDYAANAVAYWPVEEVRAKFESRCDKSGESPEEVLADLLEGGQEIDEFWQTVKTNLQAGRVRLVFLADSIPAELRRVVEFLNEQMDPAEVLAIEVKQFAGGGMKTLVPRVLGQTESARQKKQSARGESRKWDEPSFFAELRRKKGEATAAIARACLEWAQSRELRIWWGQGKSEGSFFPVYDNERGKNFLFSVWTYGRIEIQFQHMKKPPFDQDANRQELARRLALIDGISIPEDSITKRPTFDLDLLSEADSLTRFLETFDWVLAEVKRLEHSLPQTQTP
ncbi:PDDEXK family nuclease [Candidatus Laterigemmans baculatus]|uniref:hypothetical protein n=1 Tax=Candidatus Laterigemmans baculatus TaxID=2770505 RepID=UPI0013DCACCD|nr:hypothetical protein [Candidatus Laterigemmans baculatus]